MKIGFTGTQDGMTLKQIEQFANIMLRYDPQEFHHGDCIGADAQTQPVLLLCGLTPRIVLHPPIDPKKRAFCKSDWVRPARSYLVRNRDIVYETDILIAAPKSKKEELRSGTWSTVRFARKLFRKTFVIYPDGSVKT